MKPVIFVQRDAAPCRARLLREILELNPSTTPAYLAKFSDEQLGDYLEHLIHANQPRDGAGAWTARQPNPPVACRESDI
jgi:hypothetical protein